MYNVYIKYPNGDIEWYDEVGSEEEARETVEAFYEEDAQAMTHGCPPTGCEYFFKEEP